jgi:hypothetical protein
MSGSGVLRFAELCALIVKRPRTRQELVELMGSEWSVVNRHIKALEGEGLVVRAGKRSQSRSHATVFAWAYTQSSGSTGPDIAVPGQKAPHQASFPSVRQALQHPNQDMLHRFFFAQALGAETCQGGSPAATVSKVESASGVPA